MNFVGFITLYTKEVKRFLSVIVQTIISPMVNIILFVTVFHFVLGDTQKELLGTNVPYVMFIIPGLIAMSVMQNSFANNGTGIILSKIYGNIIDVLTAPLSIKEILGAWMLAGATRGCLIAIINIMMFSTFTDFTVTFVPWFLAFLLLGSILMALIGVAIGIWARNFNEFSYITEFFITPLTFLSGTFFDVSLLPNVLQTIISYNPIFYVIDGIRYAVIGTSYANPWFGLWFLSAMVLVLWVLCYTMLYTGYKIKT